MSRRMSRGTSRPARSRPAVPCHPPVAAHLDEPDGLVDGVVATAVGDGRLDLDGPSAGAEVWSADADPVQVRAPVLAEHRLALLAGLRRRRGHDGPQLVTGLVVTALRRDHERDAA